MNSIERILATGIIWLAVAGIAIAMIVSDGTANVFLYVVLLGAAFLSTAVIWGTSVALASNKANADKQAKNVERNYSDKPKRQSQSSIDWVNDLDSDQIAALESALTARRAHLDEDEQININRLLAEQENARKGF